MKDPLNKRLPREFKSDLGKYAVIFLFLIMLISLVSGFLVATNSMIAAYDEGFEKYNIEHGHITFTKEPPEELIARLESSGDIRLCDLRYFNEPLGDDKTTRVYIKRDEVNKECIMKGKMPETADEITLDRMFAENNKLAVGDTVTIKGKTLTVCGLTALPDYSSLYESNNEMMFDSIGFNVGIMTKEGFESLGSAHVHYNYAWKYNKEYDRNDKVKANDMSEALIGVLSDVITEYDESLIHAQTESPDFDGKVDMSAIIEVEDYVPQYLNQAINFAGDDLGGDKAMFLLFAYVVIAVLAFIFAVTISGTISADAGVIGTLRASGYTRGELTRHYLVLPVIITVISAVIGNIIGYTLFKNIMAEMYYNSYSLPTYKVLWNGDAFVATTLVPAALMLVINLAVISSKLKLTPLQFLRRELKKKPKKKSFRLNTKIPFITRFRLRIIFQNLPSYAVMIFGVVLGALVIILGDIFGTMFDDYADTIVKSVICDYQYVLTDTVETDSPSAEKYSMNSFEFKYKDYLPDSISVFGIENGSRYVFADVAGGKTAVSNTLSEKYNIKEGDTITLSDPYKRDVSYTFTVDSVYDYDASLALFISRESFGEMFGKDENYFTGYFSNEELTDIDEKYIASTITVSDYTKLATQLKHSLGSFVVFFEYFGVVMFVLIMYILSKQVIERNFQSISMCKILGFKNGEIGGLYILSSSVAVIIGLLAAVPFTDSILRLTFSKYLYKMMKGYFPYNARPDSFVKMIILGILSYAVVAAMQMIKINRVSKSEALKNRE